MLNCYVLCTVLFIVLYKCVYNGYCFLHPVFVLMQSYEFTQLNTIQAWVAKILVIPFMHDLVKIIKEVIHTWFAVVHTRFADIKIFITSIIFQGIIKDMSRSCFNQDLDNLDILTISVSLAGKLLTASGKIIEFFQSSYLRFWLGITQP